MEIGRRKSKIHHHLELASPQLYSDFQVIDVYFLIHGSTDWREVTVGCIYQWATGVMTSIITSSHQWCKSFPFPFSTINSYSPTLSFQDVKQAHWLAMGNCGKVLPPSIRVSISSSALGSQTEWECSVSAGIGKTGAGSSRQLESRERHRTPATAAGVIQGSGCSALPNGRSRSQSGKAHEGKKGLVEWQFYSKLSPNRSSRKERGNTRKVMQIKELDSSYTSHGYPDFSWAVRMLGGFARDVRFHLLSLEILPFNGKVGVAPVFSTLLSIPKYRPKHPKNRY